MALGYTNISRFATDFAMIIWDIISSLNYYMLLYQLRTWIKRIHIQEELNKKFEIEDGSVYSASDDNDQPNTSDDQPMQSPLIGSDQVNLTEVESTE